MNIANYKSLLIENLHNTLTYVQNNKEAFIISSLVVVNISILFFKFKSKSEVENFKEENILLKIKVSDLEKKIIDLDFKLDSMSLLQIEKSKIERAYTEIRQELEQFELTHSVCSVTVANQRKIKDKY